MTEDEARKAYEAYYAPQEPPDSRTEVLPDGSWAFIQVKERCPDPRYARYECVVVRARGTFRIAGVPGKVLLYAPELGAPTSEELFLGTTAFGRYQAFDCGVVVWEGDENIGYPVRESMSLLRSQRCIVAFLDLRGFTSWSQLAPEGDVQQAIQACQSAVHEGFPVTSAPWERLFLKGTGDGVMIVSQADWYRTATGGKHLPKLVPGHAKDFLCACQRTVDFGAERLKHYGYPLAVGCGIAVGELVRVFLFGRLDFIGPAANEAAKLQQHAWGEICVTPDFGKALTADGWPLDLAHPLADKGWRLPLETPGRLQALGGLASGLEPTLARRSARRWSRICRRFRWMK